MSYYTPNLLSSLDLGFGRLIAVPAALPDRLTLYYDEVPISQTWHSKLAREGLGTASWGPYRTAMVDVRKGLVKILNREFHLQSLVTLTEFLQWLHFEVAVVGDGYQEWYDNYEGPGFADRHEPLGFACAFKGEGHDRLVSRRWLEHGPWRLIRDEDTDLSFVQFHDLDADPETALEQAKPGHQRMGISKTGGFIQKRFVYSYDWDGIYLPEEQVLEVVVHGRAVEQREMLEACALRHYQALGDDKPLKNIRYVFMTENEARQNLHELWLRELECWAIVDGEKVRLDDGYVPPAPVKPAWVQALEG